MAPARILIETHAYHHLNVGDAAMLQIALERLGALWPRARLDVLTDDPERLRGLCPRAVPVPADGRRAWFGDLVPAVHRRLGEGASQRLRRAESAVRQRCGRSAATVLRARYRLRRRDSGDLDRFLDSVRHAELLVVTGAGAVNDEYASLAITVLDLVDAVIRRGVPTAMLGQGLGPLTNPALLRRSGQVLPRVDLIGLREGVMGCAILERLGVDRARYVVTGDDALELADRLPVVVKQPKLGVNLRRARYAGIGADAEASVRDAVTAFVRRHDVPAVPVPVSFVPHEADRRSIDAVLGPASTESSPPDDPPCRPDEVVRLCGECRVVLTGSYHAAVFALGQGTPVVAIAASRYYEQKFFGLRALFGPGCHVVEAGDDLAGRLGTALESAWATSGDVTVGLRAVARDLVERSRQAYARLRDVVGA